MNTRYKFWYGYIFSILLCKYLWGNSGTYGDSVFNILRHLLSHCFSKVLESFYTTIGNVWGLQFLYPCQHLFLVIFNRFILVGVKLYLTAVLIYIFLLTSDVENIHLQSLAVCIYSLTNFWILWPTGFYFSSAWLWLSKNMQLIHNLKLVCKNFSQVFS